mmetsp:Transcript_16622/g.36225  ORF Transcript_16622/g.36225 Transcript_16622/m.36225 type:complete len:148 (+) Transcript_16622:313-756(+)
MTARNNNNNNNNDNIKELDAVPMNYDDKEKVEETTHYCAPKSETASTADTNVNMNLVAEPLYPDDDRPDPKNYMESIRQRQGDSGRPDDYLPGTEPYGFVNAYTGREKVKVKKQCDPNYYGMSRVDDWLGSGVKPKRTWRVKGERKV